jgi:hypothetical protein
LAIHAWPFDHSIESSRDLSARGQEPKKVSHYGDGLLKSHSTHPLAKVLDELFQLGDCERGQPLWVVRILQPLEKFGGNLSLPPNRCGSVSPDLIQMLHESIHVNVGRIRRQ